MTKFSRISRRVADFECTTDSEDCRVWAWMSVNIDDENDIKRGTDIESFIKFSETTCSETYFHNLAYDGTFILDYILKHGYKWCRQFPRQGEFTTLIDKFNKFYSIKICSHNGVTTEFRDSLKKLPLSVSDIAKSFDLEEQKLTIDYNLHRAIGYEPTDHEWNYIKNDVTIVAKALKTQFDKGLTKLTVGSDALSSFKSSKSRKQFQNLFPQLSDRYDRAIREAYRGGFTYADPRFTGRLLGSGSVFDVNSLYPFVLSSRLMPTGIPELVEGWPPDDKLSVMSITFTAQLKPGHIPCIQVKKSPHYKPTQYLEVIDEPVQLTCTSIDLALWMEHYDMNIISCDGAFVFNSIDGVFDDYVSYWANVKANSTGGTRTLAKLMLNSLYGKFATNTDVTGKIPYLRNGHVAFRMDDNTTRPPVYTPVGVFVTAYARDYTIRTAQRNYDCFAYADTDSVHLVGCDTPVLEEDGSRLGAWKREYDFSEAVFVRAKQYSEREVSGVVHTHIAGAPRDITHTLVPTDLLSSAIWHGKLVPQRVPGGVVLRETTFTFESV